MKIKKLSINKKIHIFLFLINLLITAILYFNIGAVISHIRKEFIFTFLFAIMLILFIIPFICYLRGIIKNRIYLNFLNGLSFFLFNYNNLIGYSYGFNLNILMGIYTLVIFIITATLVITKD